MEYTNTTMPELLKAASYWLRDSESIIVVRPDSYDAKETSSRVSDPALRQYYPLLPEIINLLIDQATQQLRPNGGAPRARNELVKSSIIIQEDQLSAFTDSAGVRRTPVLIDYVQTYMDRLYIKGLFAETHTAQVNNKEIKVVTKSSYAIADVTPVEIEAQYPGCLSRLQVGQTLGLAPEELFAYVLSKAMKPVPPEHFSHIDFT